MNIGFIILLAFLTGILLSGDYCIKSATQSSCPVRWLLLASFMWVASIPGWYYTMIKERISIVGILFSLMSLVGITLIGIICFKEHLSVKEWIGFGMAVISTILLAGKL